MPNLGPALGRAIRRARRALGAGGGKSQRRHATVTVAAAPDAALLASAAALRRLGARIARYDADEGVMEARTGDPASTVIVRATETGHDVSRLEIETDAPGARPLFRRFRAELARPPAAGG